MPDELEKFVLGDTAISPRTATAEGVFRPPQTQREPINVRNCGALGTLVRKMRPTAIDYRRSFRSVADLSTNF
jgi:hypothetical protein